ncbi:cytochrome P450 [Spirosoma soli]|uniref:Cytochrome P450 n=1 Tax=Spirosoma soli TaxID=1770529 RepID=A0ABW5LZ74_9BACT
MVSIPRENAFDSSLAVLKDGFTFIQKRCQRHGSDIFQTRLMFQNTICISGEEAVRLFYDPERFVRKGAIPKPIQKTLLGQRSIMTLDDGQHRRRKEMFMSLMGPTSIQTLMDNMATEWQAAISRWQQRNQVVFFEEVQEILFRGVCAWAGVPLDATEVHRRTRHFAAMVDAFGAVGPRHLRGRWGRQQSESWMQGIIEQVRSGQLTAPDGTPLDTLAVYQEADGQPLPARMAAIELINLIRPTVAISWYITFAALALHEHPDWRKRLQTGNGEELDWFVDEVRRFYPFAPFTGARVRSEFSWKGYLFPKATLVLLDIYGTNHDPRLWEQPDEFRPERFQNWQGNRFRLIPQGGGDYLTGHRCAGEWITIEATKVALRYLTGAMEYNVPEQDFHYSLSRMPTMPKSRFIIRQVQPIATSFPKESVPVRPLVLDT